MEAFESEKGGQADHLVKIDFRKFIKNIELNCQKSILNRKNQLLLKQKLKDNWLNKSKIIPPSFPKVQQHDAHHSPTTLKPSNFHENQFSLDGTDTPLRSEGEVKETSQRKMCKTSHETIRNAVSCDKIRSNWKLQFRKDQLNILKYLRARDEENIEPDSTAKSFKVRKLPKKFDEIKPEVYSLYKTNLELSDEKTSSCIERPKTMQYSSTKQKHFC